MDEMNDEKYLRGLIEAVLFLQSEPITYNKLSSILKKEASIIKKEIKILQEEYKNRYAGIQIQELAGGIRMSTNEIYGDDLKKIFATKKGQKLSQASLETLAIIAYKQPITRAEIESIRGVSVDGIVRDLMEKGFIKVVGKKDIAGAPSLYGTTKDFLQYFGLKSIRDLPTLKEIKELKFD